MKSGMCFFDTTKLYIVIVEENMPAPPQPWTARPRISTSDVGAVAHMIDPMISRALEK